MRNPKIQLLSEGGGIGDVLRRLSIAYSIREAIPNAEVWTFVQDSLLSWAQLDPVASPLVVVNSGARRGLSQPPDPARYPYLDINVDFDRVVDLYDPAESYENAAFSPINHSRWQKWREVASNILGEELPLCHIKIPRRREWVLRTAGWLHKQKDLPERYLVGIQPLSHWKWRSLSKEQVAGMVDAFRLEGAKCILFHHEKFMQEWAEEMDAWAMIGADPRMIVETVRICDAIITGDSAFFHIGGFLERPTVGLFAQTNGEAIGSDYRTCHAIMAGERERVGLECTMPCYRRASYGCKPSCRKGCLALERINPAVVVEKVLQLIEEETHGFPTDCP